MEIEHLSGILSEWVDCIIVDGCILVSCKLSELEQRDIISGYGAMLLSIVAGGIA